VDSGEDLNLSLFEALQEDLVAELKAFPGVADAFARSAAGEPIEIDLTVFDDKERIAAAGAILGLLVNWALRLATEADGLRAELEKRAGPGDSDR
jgi:hypothetical protein